jgi:Fibronectin type III domain
MEFLSLDAKIFNSPSELLMRRLYLVFKELYGLDKHWFGHKSTPAHCVYEFSIHLQFDEIQGDIQSVYSGRKPRGGLNLLPVRRHSMNKNLPFWRTARVAMILVLLMSVFGTSPALAAQDRKPPTKPANLRVTSLTPHRVTLAWDPSTDNSGTFTYRVFVSWGSTTTLPQTQTTYSVSLVPANTYSFYVYAVDGSGNVSQRSNTLTVTTPPDTTPPTAPVVSLVGVNPTEVSLQWTASTDDGLHIRYQVFVNGSPSGLSGGRPYLKRSCFDLSRTFEGNNDHST